MSLMCPCSDLFLSLECPFSVPPEKPSTLRVLKGFSDAFWKKSRWFPPGVSLKKQFDAVP